ncbi:MULTISPECIES: hypothetical protein [Modicisalibacter]|uniref:DUF1641 domain-containing protein n=1 Tax=Modicisalibacter tunisiensis TaxID=390637 RepID=A0ABS7X3U4_9GAMM|nr:MULTISPECIES: hypothetical protein [Modicisalibacter]MBZ9537982.1 hypothetical protein [Modicisalibacter tunisiensis]MBZ9568601.1 hypothetical protein [Modicisalibacter tunisiensis]
MKNDTAAASIQSLETILESSPALQDPATLKGVVELIEKVSPLLQGRRLHNIVDLLAAASDVIEMTDDAMIQKLMTLYDDSIGGAWKITSALQYASVRAGQKEAPPTLWKSVRRLNNDEDARRGLDTTINLMSELGRQSRISGQPVFED